MGFLFFRKKRSESDEALEKVNQISNNLKNSFNRIKSDIKVIRDWLSFFKTKNEEYNQNFKNIESRLDEMGEVLAYLTEKDQIIQKAQISPKAPKEAQYYDYEEPRSTKITPLDHLTDTQKAIFFRLGAFQRESGQEWTPLKTLAQDIYPGKTYDKVRSTISEYIGILVDVSLIKKNRKGKQTYIGITEKGQEYLQQNAPKNTKKPLQKGK
ncbi:MAG: hypothetical protein Q8Q42_00410 [Nanoarchaeota archaeon]|nr:hypothetical protein [Nanoarchaeota archaeon]